MRYTPTQQRILALLSDGRGHTKEEVMTCFNDTMVTDGGFTSQISLLRAKLKHEGMDIVARSGMYQQVRFIQQDR